MPLGTARLSTGSGDIRLERVEGDLGVSTGSGDVRVEHAAGTVRASTGSGSIDIGEAADALGPEHRLRRRPDRRRGGPTTVKVGSGDITIERIRDHSVATSGSGDVRSRSPTGRASGPRRPAVTSRSGYPTASRRTWT